jgi:hypothetical protein
VFSKLSLNSYLKLVKFLEGKVLGFMINLKDMQGMEKFCYLRERYEEFVYENYHIMRVEGAVEVVYDFVIPGVAEFHPSWSFPAEDYEGKEEAVERFVFSLGMVELISYWKAVCPPKVVLKCGYLSKEQEAWWKKLYFHGLGEFFYVNGIETDEREFMSIVYEEREVEPVKLLEEDYQGCLVPVGGGKDSVVSLEILKKCPGVEITTFSVNRIEAVKNVIEICEEKSGDIKVRRSLDQELLRLNREGYLNGHTPFSAIVAFSSVLTAILNHKRYITLSNETSANESTVRNSTVNHQYSKSFQFEKDFDWYAATLMDSPIHYFSLLRPLTEIQIAKIFAGAEKYHKAFRSCNAGSKQGIWCCECPKCLFVYIILSPFLSKEKLHEIFGQDLLEKESMDKYFRELAGIDENKPFECVGTRSEVLASLKYLAEKEGEKPLLVDRYREYILKNGTDVEELLGEWCDECDVPEKFLGYVREALEK